MNIVGDFEIMKKMMSIRKRELNEDLKSLKAKLRDCKKSRTKLLKEELDTDAIDYKIDGLERDIETIESDIEYYSSKFQPVRLFDTVINYKFLQEILRKTKMLNNVSIQKGNHPDTVEIVWDNEGSKGKYTLYSLAEQFKEVIYIPELEVNESA